MKIVFFGASGYVLPVVEILKSKFELEHVITTERLGSDPLIKFCIQNKIPYSSVSSKDELLKIVNHQSSIINRQLGIVADFGIIIPKEVLESFAHGVLNIHPSLLPKYRGSTPVQTALLNGDKTTGVTIIKLDEYVDHGPILAQETEAISPEDTAESLYEILFAKGAQMLSDVIEPFSKGKVELREQNHKNATFTKSLKRDDGYIDISYIPPAEQLDRMIRAYYPWPGVWVKTKVNEESEKIIKFLPNKKIQVEGKKEMSYKDFLNGYPNADLRLRNFLEQYV